MLVDRQFLGVAKRRRHGDITAFKKELEFISYQCSSSPQKEFNKLVGHFEPGVFQSNLLERLGHGKGVGILGQTISPIGKKQLIKTARKLAKSAIDWSGCKVRSHYRLEQGTAMGIA
jgi:hypothetical protein